MKKKNKSNSKEDFNEIREYYTKALAAFESKDPNESAKIVLNMPVRLYDMSLDILDNKNDEFSDQELRTLIETVDEKLTSYSKSSLTEEELGEDGSNSLNDTFGIWEVVI